MFLLLTLFSPSPQRISRSKSSQTQSPSRRTSTLATTRRITTPRKTRKWRASQALVPSHRRITFNARRPVPVCGFCLVMHSVCSLYLLLYIWSFYLFSHFLIFSRRNESQHGECGPYSSERRSGRRWQEDLLLLYRRLVTTLREEMLSIGYIQFN